MARPKKNIKPEQIAEIEDMAGRGLTLDQIAGALGICKNTLYRNAKECEQIEQAIKSGQAKALNFVAGKLFEQIENGNTTATIFYLKTRGGWRETQRLEHSTPEGESIKIDNSLDMSKLSDDELREIIRISEKARTEDDE